MDSQGGYRDRVLQGDCRAIMAQMPDGVFITTITSPPYWGLRDYDLEPVVWDGDPECQHEWNGHHQKPRGGKCTQMNSPNTGGNRAMQEMGSLRGEGIDSSFCAHCGAWLGCLGLEPTPELYVDHLVQIFREVRRVLKDDGTLWLVIGDSYWGGKGKSGYELPHEAAERNAKGETFQNSHNVPGYMDMRPADGKHHIIKPKDMVMIPFRLALALQADGWWVRSDIIWNKENPMPESVRDRPTKSHEYVFLLSISKKYYYDQDAIREPYAESSIQRVNQKTFDQQKGGDKDYRNGINPNRSMRNTLENFSRSIGKGRNKRTVWTVNTKPYKGAHFATFPPKLIEPMILAGSAEGDIVFDPFAGSGTTLAEAKRHGRHYCGIEANPEYVTMIDKRIAGTVKAQLKLDL